jgi:pSer/pThr/pTyr-binding forkhead associated (FHA) protein
MPVSILIHRSSSPGKTKEKVGDDPPTLTLDGSRIVIGRGAGSEVRLPDVSVSHRHASIRVSGSEYVLVDEGSTNGTVVGGVRLSPHTPRALRSGDLVRIGRVWLEVRFDQKPPTRDVSGATRDIALALVADAMALMGDDVVPRVRVVEGADMGATLPLAEEGRVYLVGRAAEIDLPLEDAEASRQHLQIVRRGNAVLVRDLGSKNPAQLGGTPLSSDRDAPWRGQAVIRIGATVLALEEPVAAALAELEQADDEPVALGDAPPPPSPRGEGEGDAREASSSKPEVAPSPSARTAAPVASPPALENTVKLKRPRRRRWSGTDFAVVIAALGVIALSAAGLYWLLRP